MYDLPEVRRATDAWWAGLAHAFERAGVAGVPACLERHPEPEGAWRDPGLLFSQTCGYPLIRGLAGVVRPVATPAYEVEGCRGASYRSFFVVREDEPARGLAGMKGRRAAVNATHSQSGYNCLRRAVAPLAGGRPFFAEVVTTGGHRASLAAVKEGRADLAAVDCVTYGLLAHYRPAAITGLRVLGESAAAPSLPYVTRAAAAADLLARLREGLRRALDEPGLATAREALFLADAEVLGEDAYESIGEMEREAVVLGYPEVV
jgi:ABC-type phosphate/phosphonate transport system substrate-binding protein